MLLFLMISFVAQYYVDEFSHIHLSCFRIGILDLCELFQVVGFSCFLLRFQSVGPGLLFLFLGERFGAQNFHC